MLRPAPAFRSFRDIFGRRDPRKDAGQVLARLLSQLDLLEIPFDNGIQVSRRDNSTRYMAVGVWLILLGEKQDPATANFDNAMPAVTSDIRRLGVGLLLPIQLPAKRLILAVPDPENHWKFFDCSVAHHSPRPGGWFKVGLSINGTCEPEPLSLLHFRNRVESAFAPLSSAST